jgi:hypothetical protein
MKAMNGNARHSQWPPPSITDSLALLEMVLCHGAREAREVEAEAMSHVSPMLADSEERAMAEAMYLEMRRYLEMVCKEVKPF